MKVKISGFYDEVSTDIDEQIKLAKKLGETYICPRNIGAKNIADYTAEEFITDVKPKLDKAGIRFSSIGSPIGKVGIDDDEGIEKQKRELKELIKIAEAMDCKYIRIFSFFVKAADYEVKRGKVMDRMKELVELTEGTGVTLLHENEKGIFGATDANCLDIFRTMNSEHLGLIYDASNFIQCGVDPLLAFDLLKDYVVYYHVKDCDAETDVEIPLGLGNGQYKKIFRELAERNFEGFMTLEPHTYKYAIYKAPVYFVPFMPLIKRAYFKTFRKVDKFLKNGLFKTASREDMFVLQYNQLKTMLKDAENALQAERAE